MKRVRAVDGYDTWYKFIPIFLNWMRMQMSRKHISRLWVSVSSRSKETAEKKLLQWQQFDSKMFFCLPKDIVIYIYILSISTVPMQEPVSWSNVYMAKPSAALRKSDFWGPPLSDQVQNSYLWWRTEGRAGHRWQSRLSRGRILFFQQKEICSQPGRE